MTFRGDPSGAGAQRTRVRFRSGARSTLRICLELSARTGVSLAVAQVVADGRRSDGCQRRFRVKESLEQLEGALRSPRVLGQPLGSLGHDNDSAATRPLKEAESPRQLGGMPTISRPKHCRQPAQMPEVSQPGHDATRYASLQSQKPLRSRRQRQPLDSRQYPSKARGRCAASSEHRSGSVL